MTRNREISKLGEYITINSATDTIDFGSSTIVGTSAGIGTTSNVNTSGIVTASFFYGNGSNLTGLIGVGAGVAIRSNGVPVGTATTLDFISGINFSSGIGTISGGSVGSRSVVSGSTGSIAANASSNITITGFKSYCLLKAEVSVPAWVTLYTDTTSRTNDASRLITQDPVAGSGVIAEFITSTNSETVLFTPTTIGFNNDSPAANNIYLKVQNRSGITASVSISLTIIQLET